MADLVFADNRLDFVLPDFTRVAWVSDELRAVWQPKVGRISEALAEIEWRSVLEGVRRCALTVVAADQLIEKAGVWAEHGLSGLPLQTHGLTNQYSATAVDVKHGEPFAYRIVIGRPTDVAELKRAYDAANDVRMGELLGYPDCCQAFFRDTWVEQGMVDTTWPMAANTKSMVNGGATIKVGGPAESNILWRWASVRAVPHLPCSFDCENTVNFAKALEEVGRKAGYGQEMDWMKEILEWPAEWSALHGIAEVKTPLLRVSTRTDATSIKFSVRRESDTYPQDGISGLNFPYHQPKKPILTGATHFKRGLANPIRVALPKPSWYASDNGFPSVIAMEAAHEPIIQEASKVLGSSDGGAVLDLGCGNGALLKSIIEGNDNVVPFGIDVEPKRIAHAGLLLTEFADNFVVGNLSTNTEPWTHDRRYALALVMPGRLVEAEPEEAKTLRQNLAKHCDNVLIYAYGDWLTRYGNLQGLADAAGLSLLSEGDDVMVGLASVMENDKSQH